MGRDTLTVKPWSLDLCWESRRLHEAKATKEQWADWSQRVKEFQDKNKA